MKRANLGWMACLGAFVSFSAQAAIDAVTVHVPESRIERAKVDAADTGPTLREGSKLEAALSSWSPRDFELDTLLPEGATPFHGNGAPLVELSYLSSPLRLGTWADQRAEIAWKAGVGFYSMSREASGGRSQSLYLLPWSVGFEVRPLWMKTRRFTPYGAFSVLPTFAMTSRSALAESDLLTGIPMELAAGATVDLDWVALDLGVQVSFGKVQNLDYYGTGLEAGLRF